ncbi:unnamed protein product [Lepidochelys kempii]
MAGRLRPSPVAGVGEGLALEVLCSALLPDRLPGNRKRQLKSSREGYSLHPRRRAVRSLLYGGRVGTSSHRNLERPGQSKTFTLITLKCLI